MMPSDRNGLAERLRQRVIVDPDTGCWLPRPGARAALVRWQGERMSLHVAAFVVQYGKRPEAGKRAAAFCGTLDCVRPCCQKSADDSLIRKRIFAARVNPATRRARIARTKRQAPGAIPEETVAALREAQAQGMPIQELVDRFGVSRRHVFYLCQHQRRVAIQAIVSGLV